MIHITKDTRVVALTGAGISAESGIKTFRDGGGLWENHRIEDVASPKGFNDNPRLVWEFYLSRYLQSQQVEPNPGHHALVKLEKFLKSNFFLVTQNVDGLHNKAGQEMIYEMHGRLSMALCTNCKKKHKVDSLEFNDGLPICNSCSSLLRPDIIWFSEVPYFLSEIDSLIKKCDLFLIIGTSGVVYPAAGFAMMAKFYGAQVVSINLDKPDNITYIDEFYQGKAGELLPKLVDAWIADKTP